MHQISPSVCGSLMWQQNNRVPSQPNRTHSACKTDTEKPNSRFPWLFASTGVNGTMCVALQTHRTEYSEGFSRNPVKRCFFPLASLFKQAIDPVLLIYDTNFFSVKAVYCRDLWRLQSTVLKLSVFTRTNRPVHYGRKSEVAEAFSGITNVDDHDDG